MLFVIPPWLDIIPGEYTNSKGWSQLNESDIAWYDYMRLAEDYYKQLIDDGWSPQQARSVLPNSTKTEIVVTTNFREWRHIFKLRCSKAAHPQIREIMIPLHEECKIRVPVIFDDIEY